MPARQQRSDVTQAQVLDAAIRVLVDRGYAGASTLAIQAEAGVSRGRMLHHFPSRDELLIAAVGHLAQTRLEDLVSQFEWPDSPDERIRPAIEIGWSTFHQPYFVASMELWMAARTNPRLSGVVLPGEREVGATVRNAVAEFLGPELASSPHFDELYPVLLTSMRGTALTYLFDRRDPKTEPYLDLWENLTRRYLLTSTSSIEPVEVIPPVTPSPREEPDAEGEDEPVDPSALR